MLAPVQSTSIIDSHRFALPCPPLAPSRDCRVNGVFRPNALIKISGEGAVMATLDVVPKKKPEPSAEELAAKEWVRLARSQGLSLTGPDGLLKQFTKSVLETALNEEMTEHLGHEKHRAPEDRDSTNIRKGTRPKTVQTEATGRCRSMFRGTGTARSNRRS